MPEHQQTQQSTESKTTFQKQATPRVQTPVTHPIAIIQRARVKPKSLTHADVMQLQRTIGNRAVGRLLSEMGLIPSTTKQAPPVQRQELVQRQEIHEEELLQGKFESIRRQEIPGEEVSPLQGVFERKIEQTACHSCIQKKELEEEEPLQAKMENNTGMPDNLKAGVENLSGIDMSDVRVHYNSSKPAEVRALAYTQGTNIHVAPGQEKHLPHEAWHVVQQAQGRVQPTMQLKDVAVNDKVELEHEADTMGVKVTAYIPTSSAYTNHEQRLSNLTSTVTQRYTIIRDGEFEGKLSQSEFYLTSTNNEDEMYVCQGSGHTVERSNKTDEVATVQKVDYEIWKPQFNVIEDCAAGAEEIMHGKLLKYGAPGVSEFVDASKSSPHSGSSAVFGESDEQNRRLGKETDKGVDAHPDILSAFTIVRQGASKTPQPQFHCAAVVATDGNDDITLETTAPESGKPSSKRVAPTYNMYNHGGKKKEQSFKVTYADQYGGDATVSVLKAKTPLDTFKISTKKKMVEEYQPPMKKPKVE